MKKLVQNENINYLIRITTYLKMMWVVDIYEKKKENTKLLLPK